MRKIAVLVRTWSNGYFKELVDGIKDYIQNKDVQVDIYNAYDCGNDERTKAETQILYLPQPDFYDALIINLNIDTLDEKLDKIADNFIERGKPVISIDQHYGAINSVCIDNYAASRKIVEHMVVEHNCKKLQFVGGYKDYIDSEERYRAFVDVLTENGLEIDQRYVGFYYFLFSDGEAALKSIVDNNLELPDAVICANDSMAIGYIKAATSLGYRVPEDILVCGFDNSSAGQTYYPSITSINKDIPTLAHEAIRLVCEALNGAKIPDSTLSTGKFVINESCGCPSQRDSIQEYKNLLQSSQQLDFAEIRQRNSRAVLCGCRSFEDLMGALDINIHKYNIPMVALFVKDECINGDPDLISFSCSSSNMTCYTYNRIINRVNPGTINKSEIFGDNQIYIYSPLYFNDKSFGFCLIPYIGDNYDMKQHTSYTDSISIAIENIIQKIHIDTMNRKFKELYVIDQLTGLYNRFGYSSMSGRLVTQENGKIYIVYIDLDGLKTINDTLGHETGDSAIIGAATCIKKVFNDTDIHVRMGGDEFLVVGPFTNEANLVNKEDQLSQELEQYSKDHELPFVLKASIGHSYNTEELKETELSKLMKIADTNMYNHKMAKKSQR